MKTYTLLIGLAICGLTPGANAETIPEPPAPKLFTDMLDRTCDVENIRIIKSVKAGARYGVFSLSFKPSKSRTANKAVYDNSTDKRLPKILKPGAKLCGFDIPKIRDVPETPTSEPEPKWVEDVIGNSCGEEKLLPVYVVTKNPIQPETSAIIYFKPDKESAVVVRNEVYSETSIIRSIRRGTLLCFMEGKGD